MRLLDAAKVSGGDTVYVLGDVIDKGKEGFRLLDFVRKNTRVFKTICGNHEHALLGTYHDIMEARSDGDYDEVLEKLRLFYPTEGKDLTWELVDFLETLPYYIEKKDFICVHAGVRLRPDGSILPLREQSENVLTCDRTFKEDRVIPMHSKTVLFGHTPCSYENGTGRFIKTLREGAAGTALTDHVKIRLDTGVKFTGVLGMLRADDLREWYV